MIVDRYQRPEEFKTLNAVGFEPIMELQQLFIDFDETNIDETVSLLLKNELFTTLEGIDTFVDDLFRSIAIRHYDIQLFVSLITKLSTQKTKVGKLSNVLITEITRKCTEPTNEWRITERVTSYHFLRILCQAKLVKIETIIPLIQNFPTGFPLQFLMLFYYFAPEISNYNLDILKKMVARINEDLKVIKAIKGKNDIELQFIEAASKLDKFAENGFAGIVDYIDDGVKKESLEYAIKKDDELLLSELVDQSGYDLNKKIKHNIFEPCLFVNWDPSPCEYAAYFRSERCFKFIMKRGVKLGNVASYATAGGNEKILKILAAKKCLFFNCPRIATYFRRSDIFEWIMTKHKEGLIMKKELNFALCRACANNYIDMIVQCIDIGANINCFDENQMTPLMIAAVNECYETTEYLLRYKSLRLLTKDMQGKTALDLSREPRITKLIQDAINEL